MCWLPCCVVIIPFRPLFLCSVLSLPWLTFPFSSLSPTLPGTFLNTTRGIMEGTLPMRSSIAQSSKALSKDKVQIKRKENSSRTFN